MSAMTVTRSRTSSRKSAATLHRIPQREQLATQNILHPTASHEIHVRMATDADQIETVVLTVVPLEGELEEIDLDRHILGYIQQAGQVFVALVGERLDRAEECGQSLLWDKAAAELVRSARLAAEAS